MSDFLSSYAAFWHYYTCAGPVILICLGVVAFIFLSALGGEAGAIAGAVMLFFFITTVGASIEKVSDLEIISYWMGAITPSGPSGWSHQYQEWNFPSVMAYIFCMINILFIPYAILCFLSAIYYSCDSSEQYIKGRVFVDSILLALGIPYTISNIYTICFVFFNGLGLGDTIMYALSLFFMNALYIIALYAAFLWYSVLFDD